MPYHHNPSHPIPFPLVPRPSHLALPIPANVSHCIPCPGTLPHLAPSHPTQPHLAYLAHLAHPTPTPYHPIPPTPRTPPSPSLAHPTPPHFNPTGPTRLEQTPPKPSALHLILPHPALLQPFLGFSEYGVTISSLAGSGPTRAALPPMEYRLTYVPTRFTYTQICVRAFFTFTSMCMLIAYSYAMARWNMGARAAGGAGEGQG